MAFHENLRAIRLAKGLTQPALAETAQIEQSYLSKLENGRSSPSDEVLGRLAAALGTTGEELMRNGGDADATPWHDRRVQGALAAAVLVALLVGWLGHGAWRAREGGAAAPDLASASLTERLYGLTPPGLQLETVAIDDDGTLTIAGHMADRALVTAYLAELRRGGIGEATLMTLSDSDTRFHIRLAPFQHPKSLTPAELAAAAAEHDVVMKSLETVGGAALQVQRVERSSDGSYYAAGTAADPAAANTALDALSAQGFVIASRRVEGDARGARFELSFKVPSAGAR